MRSFFLPFIVYLITTNIAAADVVCLKTVLKKGKISQSVKTVASGLKCPKGFKSIVDTESLRGPQGLSGPAGLSGAPGAAGSFTSVLPSGVTLRGAFGQYAVGENTAYKVSMHSFGAALAVAPTIHLILSGTNAPAECPGSSSAPEALPGHLCLFEFSGIGRVNAAIFSPSTGGATGNKYGFGYVFQSNANFSNSYGTWAVTAP